MRFCVDINQCNVIIPNDPWTKEKHIRNSCTEPIVNITSAAGLVTIVTTDAAGTDGLQQILNVQ